MSWNAIIRGDSRILELVGEQYYQDAYKRVLPIPDDGEDHIEQVLVELVPEPHNRHDSNAVAVQYKGETLAYVARTNAARLQAELIKARGAGARTYFPAAIGMRRLSEGGLYVDARIGLPVLREIVPQALAQKSTSAAVPASAPGAGGKKMTRWGNPRDLVIFLLSFFLGYLGIDRFVNGNYVLGAIKLLTLGGAGVWWIIDFVIFFFRWAIPQRRYEQALLASRQKR